MDLRIKNRLNIGMCAIGFGFLTVIIFYAGVTASHISIWYLRLPVTTLTMIGFFYSVGLYWEKMVKIANR